MLIYNRAGSRWRKLAAYMGAAVIPCLPLAWLYIQSPRQTLFNVLDYHYFYRRLAWEDATVHDIGVMIAWLDSSSALPLALLAMAGLWFVYKRSAWDRAQRAEFYLCAWLSVGLICHIASAHPNFTRYYMLAVPFLAILACAGLYAAGSRLVAPDRPFWPAAILCLLACLGIGKAVFDGRDDMSWLDVEKVARKVNEVTPPAAVLLADEPTYFVTRHPPYPGTELRDSHKLTLPPAVEKQMHVMSLDELDRLIKAGTFDTVETDDGDERVEKLGLRRLYKQHFEIGDDSKIFWDKAR